MDFTGKHVFLVGIKGTGMASLAVLLSHAGADVTGCDTAEVFATDALLSDAAIPVSIGFDSVLLPADAALVVHSSAWKIESCPVLAEAVRRGIEVLTYPRMLAAMSEQCVCYAVAGTHGKTTTTGCAAWLLSRPVRKEYPFFALYGAAVQSRDGHPQVAGIWQGSEVGLLEACEYEDHFLAYTVRGALVTTVEHDHPDYFPNIAAVKASFRTFVSHLAKNGFLICCSDDAGAKELAAWAKRNRPDLMVIQYGFRENGPFAIREASGLWHRDIPAGKAGYEVALLQGRCFFAQLFGRELIGDIVGGALLATCMLLDRPNPRLYLEPDALVCDEALATVLGAMLNDASAFPGCIGRSEIVLEQDGITYIDDYAHHPTEIRATLASLRMRFPSRTLVVAFSPHTASRSKAYFDDFVAALSQADRVIVQATYASARHDVSPNDDISRALADALSDRMLRSMRTRLAAVVYAQDDAQAAAILAGWLQQGDLCITMGAGNNRALSLAVARIRQESHNGV
ncbi:MAG: glutamate ligase domain-containing protein [Sphaerochaetaceae bacterium]|jgi:UDP-N-acetylmuramate--alanine ligase